MSQQSLLFNERTGEVELPAARVPRRQRKATPLGKMLVDLEALPLEAVTSWRPAAEPAAPAVSAHRVTCRELADAMLVVITQRGGIPASLAYPHLPQWLRMAAPDADVEQAWWVKEMRCEIGVTLPEDFLVPLGMLVGLDGYGSRAHRMRVRLGCLEARCLESDPTLLAVVEYVEAWTLGESVDGRLLCDLVDSWTYCGSIIDELRRLDRRVSELYAECNRLAAESAHDDSQETHALRMAAHGALTAHASARWETEAKMRKSYDRDVFQFYVRKGIARDLARCVVPAEGWRPCPENFPMTPEFHSPRYTPWADKTGALAHLVRAAVPPSTWLTDLMAAADRVRSVGGAR